MVEPVITVKIFVSIFMVMGLSIVAENVSSKAAGILAGYPLGTALILFFVGLENGEDFAASSATYTLGGLSAMLFLVYIYYQSSKLFPTYGVLVPAVFSVIGFICAAALLSQLSISLLGGLFISLVAIFVFGFAFRKIENAAAAEKVKLTYGVIFFRAGVAAFVVLVVTGLAQTIGTEWSGILSAFPATLFPLLLVIHAAYGGEQVHTIIKNFPYGLGALIVYTVSVSYTYPVFGIYYGTLICFVLATIYLIVFAVLTKKFGKTT